MPDSIVPRPSANPLNVRTFPDVVSWGLGSMPVGLGATRIVDKGAETRVQAKPE